MHAASQGATITSLPRVSEISLRWACVVVPGFVLYFAPIAGFTESQRHLLAFFVATIIAFIARPVAMGLIVLLSITLIALTRTLTPEEVLAGFGNPTVWLIFSAFFFAQAVTQTQLGLRIAFFFISRLARTSLTLGYSLGLSSLVLAPVVPSDTARGGGIISPIVRNIAHALGSDPGPSAERIGAYLTLVAFHCNYAASAMFLTAMAANPLIAKIARDVAQVELTWARWALAALLPGLCTFALVPWLLHHLNPPLMKETEHAREFAREKLAAMGPMTCQQGVLLVILLAVLAGWITSPWHGIDNAVVAMAGVCASILGRVVRWDDLLLNTKAWDVLIWFGALVMMAEQLSTQGVIGVIFGHAFAHPPGWPWALSLAALVLMYVYSHYGFASLTAHITALYPGFLAAALAEGVPPPLAVLALAFLSNLNAGITHYGTGSAPIFFTLGFVSQNNWWLIGFIVSVVNVAIWMGIGPLWWSTVGLW